MIAICWSELDIFLQNVILNKYLFIVRKKKIDEKVCNENSQTNKSLLKKIDDENEKLFRL